MASTPRAVPSDTAAAVPSSPAASPTGQARHNRKKQKRAGGSNNGSHTRSSMCEAPEAKWPGSTTAADGQLTPTNAAGHQLQPAASTKSSRHSYDGASRCQAGNSQCSCDFSSSTGDDYGKAASDGTGDAANSSSGSRSSNKHSAGQGVGSRQQRRHAAGSAVSGSSRTAGIGGCSGSGDDGDDDHQDAWRRRKLAAGRGVHKQQHKPQEQQQGQQSEDGVALDTDARQQQAQPQEAAVCKLQDSRSGSPPKMNGYVKTYGPKHTQQQQQPQSPDIQPQALSIQQPGAEQHGWVPIQFGDLPVLLGASPDSSPVTAHSGSRGSRGKGSQQTIVSMPGIHHSISYGCVVGSKEPVLVQQQQHRSRSADSKQQHLASDKMTAAELASLALTAATNALTVSPRADKQCETTRPQNGRTLHPQLGQLHLEQLQQQGKGSALVNGRYSSGKAAQQLQAQEQQRSPRPVVQQQQQAIPSVDSNDVLQLSQHPQQQQSQRPRQQLVTGTPNNGSCPVTPSHDAGHAAAISNGDLPAARSPQLSPALLEQFGLRVGPLNSGLLPNELQLRASIEQAGVGAVLVVREDEHVWRQGADDLTNGSNSSGAIPQNPIAQAAGAGSSGSGTSNTAGTAEQGSSSGPAPNPVPAAAGAGHADGNGAASLGKDGRGASTGQRSPHARQSLPAISPTKGHVPPDSSAGSSKGPRSAGNSNSSPRSAGGKQSSRNSQQHGQQQQQQLQPPVQLQVQVPDAGVDDCSIASSSSSIQASSSTSNPWQQHESAVAVLQLGGGPGAHHAASTGSISARSHGHGGFGPGLGGLHPRQLYAGSVAGGTSHSSSPHLSHHMDQSDIMSDPGTVPGGGFGLGEGFGGGYSRIKPGRNRFMPNHHLGGGAGFYGSGAGTGRHHLQDQPLLMQQFGSNAGGRGGGSGGSRRGGGGNRDGDGASSRAAGSGGGRDGEGGSGRRGGGGGSGGRRNSGKDYGLPRSPQMSHGAGSNRRSFDNRGGPYGGGQDGSSRSCGRQTPLPSPGGRSNREQRDHNNSSRDVPSPHLAGSSSSNSLAGHPSPLLLPEPALVSGPGSGRGGSSSGIAPMQDLPPSAAAAAGLPPHGPPTDLERFLAATGPTVPVNPSMPLQQVLKDLTLKSVWDLFLEPSLCGTPVGTLGGPRGPSTAYYVPYMSAMQLFTTVADPSPSPFPPAPAPASSTAAASSSAAANSSSGSDRASSRSSSSSGSPTPSSCSGASSSAQSYAAVAAAGVAPAPSVANAGSGAPRSPSAAAAAAAAAAASSSVQVGPGGRGRLYTCAVKGWPPVMRLLLEHMEQELPFSRDPFYIQLEAMSGGQEAVEAAVAAAAASSSEAASDIEGAGGPAAAAAAATSNGAPSAAGSGRPTTPAVAGSYTACGYPLVGPDLMTTRLLDIHPASWFAVAWYPVYRIPDAPLTARFLTFYSFAQLLEVLNDAVSAANADLSAPCNLAGLPMPVVGMKWYNLLKERWLELLGTPGNGQQAMIPGGGRRGGNAAARAAAASSNSSDSDQPTLQLLRMHPVRFKEWQARLEDLQVQAGRLSKGGGLKVLTPQGPKEVRLYHSDYEFFNSRP